MTNTLTLIATVAAFVMVGHLLGAGRTATVASRKISTRFGVLALLGMAVAPSGALAQPAVDVQECVNTARYYAQHEADSIPKIVHDYWHIEWQTADKSVLEGLSEGKVENCIESLMQYQHKPGFNSK